MRRRTFIAVSSAGALLGATGSARAGAFPDRPVKLVVPWAAGGSTDAIARAMAQRMSQTLGQSVIVDNRAGAGGAIGASYVARAQPDGYTLLVSTPNALVVLPLMTKTTYALDNFAPIGLAATTPLVIAVRGQGPYKDIDGLLTAARGKPGQVTAGHAGPGTTNHIALLQLEQAG